MNTLHDIAKAIEAGEGWNANEAQAAIANWFQGNEVD
jgi:hypothetical protein